MTATTEDSGKVGTIYDGLNPAERLELLTVVVYGGGQQAGESPLRSKSDVSGALPGLDSLDREWRELLAERDQLLAELEEAEFDLAVHRQEVRDLRVELAEARDDLRELRKILYPAPGTIRLPLQPQWWDNCPEMCDVGCLRG